MVEDHLECLMFNPRIWISSGAGTQAYIVSRLADLIFSNVGSFRAKRIIDIIMNSIEICVVIDERKYEELVRRLCRMVSRYLAAKFSVKAVKRIYGYMNIYYLRRLPNYPCLIMYALMILVEINASLKGELLNSVKEVMKENKKRKLFFLPFVILDYFVFHLECYHDERIRLDSQESKFSLHDAVFYEYCRERMEVIDRVIGISLYFALNFNWSSVLDFAKGAPKDLARTPDSHIPFLSKLAKKVKENGVLSIVKLIISRTQLPVIGPLSYKAFATVALNKVDEFIESVGLDEVAGKSAETNAVIAEPVIFEFILREANDKFTPKAKTALTEDLLALLKSKPEFLKELTASTGLMQLALRIWQSGEDEKLVELHTTLLSSVISPSQPHPFRYLEANPAHKLLVLGKLLDATLESYADVSGASAVDVGVRCMEFAYTLEDVLETHFRKEKINDCFIKTLSKLILLLHKADLLYFSMPMWTVLEHRRPIKGRTLKELEHQEREGGVLRIVLKAIFRCVKDDRTQNSHNLLAFLIFRKEKLKIAIARFAGMELIEENRKYNLIDIILQDKEAMKQHKAITDLCMKKVMPKGSVMLNKGVVSKLSYSAKDLNFFSEPLPLSLCIFASLMELLYFALFDVEDYTQILKEDIEKVKAMHTGEVKELPSNYVFVMRLLHEIFEADIDSSILAILTTKLVPFIEDCKRKFKSVSFPFIELSLENVYSGLSCKHRNIEEKKLTDQELKALNSQLTSFLENWVKLVTPLIDTLKHNEHFMRDSLNILISEVNVLRVFPTLLFLTTHSFHAVDLYVAQSAALGKPWPRYAVEKDVIGLEFLKRTRSSFSEILFPTSKLRKDVMRSYFVISAKSLYRKLMHEQRSEVGCWFDKHHEEYQRALYAYVKQQYSKLVKRSNNCINPNENYIPPFGRFTKLSMTKDKLGRSLALKVYCKMEKDPSNFISYGYIRRFVLKKMLIRALTGIKAMHTYYYKDFQFKLVRNLFDVSIGGSASAVEESCLDYGTNPVNVELLDEHVPESMQPHSVEMVTRRGAVFGRLAIYKEVLIFHSAKRKAELKHKSAASVCNQLNGVVMVKYWKLDNIKEIVVKRYNLVRQAVEIYFKNSSSVFFSLLEKKLLLKFLSQLKEKLRRRTEVEIVENPERFFAERKFRDLWCAGQVCNFDYLMLLNKYGGRSFNDLNQYPVFPWIIQDYKSKEMRLSERGTYRELEMSVASMNEEKKKEADRKLMKLLTGVNVQYQFDVHYLPAETVFGYMARVNAYSASVLKYKNSPYAGDWAFMSMQKTWALCTSNLQDNKELIPEFYYLPEMFCNSNLKSLGRSKDNLQEMILENVELPPWAANRHQFVQMNLLALESAQTSSMLEKWIELTFGEKQQDYRFYNMYKPYSDEVNTRYFKHPLSQEQLVELQDRGLNPIRLFRDIHPGRDEKRVKEKSQHAILGAAEDLDSDRFVLLKARDFEAAGPIVYIASFERRVHVVSNAQRLYQTKESYVNAGDDRMLSFERRELGLFPFKPFYDEATRNFELHDAQRCFASFSNGALIASCRHYDNSWRIADCCTGAVKNIIHFHKAMVNCVCISGVNVFTASNDGMLAKWRGSFARPTWYASNHNSGIISLDACEKLGLVVTASVFVIIVRRSHDGKFVWLVKPGFEFTSISMAISHVRLSCRGYLVVLAKSKILHLLEGDYLATFSINGEPISKRFISGQGTAIAMGEDGYEFIIGGAHGVLTRYKLLTLEDRSMLSSLDGKYPGLKQALSEWTETRPGVTSLNLTKQEGCQALLIGTSAGQFYVYKHSPRLLSN